MEACSAIILAGGRASRLAGINKALVDVGGEPVIDRVLRALRPIANELIVVGRLAHTVDAPDIERLPDTFEPGSALVGLYSGLLSARNDAAIVVACDMPFLSTSLLARIAAASVGHDAAVPRIGPHLEALHAVYRRSCLSVMKAMIEAGQHKIIDFYWRLDIKEIGEDEMREIDPDLLSFLNLNTPADVERARSLASSGRALPS